MAKKQSPAQTLATEIVQTMQSRQESGAPLEPFRRTAERARPGVSEAELRDALATAPLKGKVVLAFDEDLDALAALKTDQPRLAGDERLLQTLVHRLCSANFPLVTIAQCKALLAKPLQSAFNTAWTTRLAAGNLPAFVRKPAGKQKPGTLLDTRFNLPWETLSKSLVQTLKRLRDGGPGSYPAPWAKVLKEASPDATPDLVAQARGVEPAKSQIVTLFQAEDAYVCLPEDRVNLLKGDALLQRFLDQVTSDSKPVTTIKELAAKLPKPDQSLFMESLDERIARNQLPGFIRALPGAKPGKVGSLLNNRFQLPWETLSKGLIETLRRLREAGESAYPAPFAKVLEETAREATPDLVKQARASEPCRSQLAVLFPGGDEVVCLQEDRAKILASDSLLQKLLDGTTSAAEPVTTLKKIAAKLPKADQPPFIAQWSERIEQDKLPGSLKALPVKKPTKPETRELHDTRHPLPWETAARKLVENLRSLRSDEAAYPPRVDRLLADVLPDAPAAIRKLALEIEAFRGQVQEIGKGADRRVFLREDGPRVAASLVASTLSALVKPDDQAIAVDKLVKGVAADLRESFESTLKKQIETGSLPRGLGALRIGKKWMLFRLEDILGAGEGTPRGAAATGSTPSATTAPRPQVTAPAETPSASSGSDGFSSEFEAAFARIDGASGGRNFVKLLDLRNALPQYGREAFDDGLRQLRVQRLFTLETSESLNTTVSDEERQAAVVEAGSRYLYCSRIR